MVAKSEPVYDASRATRYSTGRHLNIFMHYGGRRNVLICRESDLRPARTIVSTMALMRGDEQRVVAVFMEWLRQDGWVVDGEVDFVDVYARRGGERLYAEAKGRTAAVGLDVDTMYGQLLRRMKDPASGARYAVVVPTAAIQAALRVPTWVRERLDLDVYEVDDQGLVHLRR
jgi:hypothetical protein